MKRRHCTKLCTLKMTTRQNERSNEVNPTSFNEGTTGVRPAITSNYKHIRALPGALSRHLVSCVADWSRHWGRLWVKLAWWSVTVTDELQSLILKAVQLAD